MTKKYKIDMNEFFSRMNRLLQPLIDEIVNNPRIYNEEKGEVTELGMKFLDLTKNLQEQAQEDDPLMFSNQLLTAVQMLLTSHPEFSEEFVSYMVQVEDIRIELTIVETKIEEGEQNENCNVN